MLESILKLIIVFPIIIGLIFISLKYSQKFINQSGGNRHLQVVEQIRVSPKSILSIVKLGESYMLIGSSDEQVNLLKQLTPDEIQAIQEKPQQVANMNVFDAVKHVTNLKEQWKK